ncbi:MAG: hypothetical protein ABFE01_11840, partial [Phycisphaerales bacterium]
MRTLLTLLTLLTGAAAMEPENADSSPSPGSQTVIVVVGAAGAPEYAPQFARWAGLWKQACAKG